MTISRSTCQEKCQQGLHKWNTRWLPFATSHSLISALKLSLGTLPHAEGGFWQHSSLLEKRCVINKCFSRLLRIFMKCVRREPISHIAQRYLNMSTKPRKCQDGLHKIEHKMVYLYCLQLNPSPKDICASLSRGSSTFMDK